MRVKSSKDPRLSDDWRWQLAGQPQQRGQVYETHKALGSSTRKAAIAHESRQLAEEAITVAEFAFVDPGSRGGDPPDKVSHEQTTFGDAKESPSDLDTRVLER